jgi:hypothetical protein
MATDFISTNEGSQYLLTGGDGLPTTCYFLLSTTAVSGFTASSTLGGGVGEITGTGYARQSQARPTPAGNTITFAQMSWATASATNWPATVKTVVFTTTSDNTGKMICAWNLIAGGGSRDLSQANTTENVTPTLTTTS